MKHNSVCGLDTSKAYLLVLLPVPYTFYINLGTTWGNLSTKHDVSPNRPMLQRHNYESFKYLMFKINKDKPNKKTKWIP